MTIQPGNETQQETNLPIETDSPEIQNPGEESFEEFYEKFKNESEPVELDDDLILEDDEPNEPEIPKEDEPSDIPVDQNVEQLKAAYEAKLAAMADSENQAKLAAERQKALALREQGQPLAGLPETVSGYISTNLAPDLEATVAKAESIYKESMANELMPLLNKARTEGITADELEAGLVNFIETFVGHISGDLASQSIKTAVRVGEDIHARTHEVVQSKAALEIESKQLEQAFVENLNARGITTQDGVAKVVAKVNKMVAAGLHPKVAVETVFEAFDEGKAAAGPAAKDELAAKRLAQKQGAVGAGSISQGKRFDFTTDPNSWSEAQLDAYMKAHGNRRFGS